jgi:Na+-driven multidrug efflux pump
MTVNDLSQSLEKHSAMNESMYKDPETFWQMLWIVVKVSIGPIISMVFYMFVQLLNTYYVGHTNDAVLISGVGMGNMLINVLAFAVMQGLNGALETLVSRSFGLSNDKTKLQEFRRSMRRECGVLHNRGRFVVTMVMFPIIVIFIYSDRILVSLGQDPEVSRISKTYVCLMIPGVWAMGQFDSTKKFLSSQLKNSIPVWV